MGMGNAAITNPQIAVYRGDCEFDGLVFLECGSAANGESNLSVSFGRIGHQGLLIS